MSRLETSGVKPPSKQRQVIREDPRYDEIKKIIENFPPEKMELLKSYIQRWLGKN